MLIEFSVANYRSFRERVTFSLVAADGEKDLPGHVVTVDERPAKPLALLRSAAIYGPNGAGKSNLVKALHYMEGTVLGLGSAPTAVSRAPFRLDPDYTAKPSEFEVTIHQNGERYTYGFSIDDERVVEEWLYAGLPRTRMLFERTAGAKTEFGNSWRGDRSVLDDRTRPDALLLTVAAQFNHPLGVEVHNWFRKRLYVLGRSLRESYTLDRLVESQLDPDAIRRYLGAADTAIDSVDVEKVYLQELLKANSLPQDLRSGLSKMAAAVSKMSVSPPEDLYTYRVRVARRDLNMARVPFDLDSEESDGTARLLSLAGPWIDGLRDGDILVVDEFDVRLHPLLSRFLLDTWHTTDSRAQLVFATHNADLLDPTLLRRDQIWFAEKGAEQQTELYSLADFRGEQGRGAKRTDNYRRGYLAGRYGAVPITGSADDAEEG